MKTEYFQQEASFIQVHYFNVVRNLVEQFGYFKRKYFYKTIYEMIAPWAVLIQIHCFCFTRNLVEQYSYSERKYF